MQKYVKFFQLSLQLKSVKRKGWTRFPEITDVESVADHSWMISMISLSLPTNELNKDRCMKIALLHDLAEVIVGDIIPMEKVPAEIKKQKEEEAIRHMIKDLDEEIRNELYSIHQEYDCGQSVEAMVVKELDKFEMLLQAFAYEQKHSIRLDEFYISESVIKSKYVRPFVDELLKEREQYMTH